MNVTIELQESVLVQRPIEDVFAYVTDFNKAKDWRAEVVESSMSTPQMQWGTQLREVAVVLGRRVETISYVVDLESPRRWTFTHVSGPLPVSGSYDLVSKSANRTEFTYRISVGLPGIWALAAPLLRRSGRNMLRTALDRLRRNLESTDAMRDSETGWRVRSGA